MTQISPLSHQEFAEMISSHGLDFLRDQRVAIAVSGGADSMALAELLRGYLLKLPHILTVDHGLRAESASEADMVAKYAQRYGLPCHIFKWLDPKPDHGVQEAARVIRYQKMAQYCSDHGIHYLCLAHHVDDQRETFLFRLAKGSGLAGLRSMRAVQVYDDGLTLIRPLLEITHAQLIETCRSHDIPWAEDPSNLSPKYMRGRMRAVQDLLDQEGLTSRRISTLTRRIERAENLIDQVCLEKFIEFCRWRDEVCEVDFSSFSGQLPEIQIRLLQKIINGVRERANLPVKHMRLEDIERLQQRMCALSPSASSYPLPLPSFRGATLGGIKLMRRKDILIFRAE